MATPRAVLLMARELAIGGSERQLTALALALDRTRFSPHVACFHEGFRADELRAAGIPVLPLPVTSFRNWSAARGARMLGRYLREHDIEVVHTFDAPMNVFGVPVARLYRTPVVLSSQRAHRELSGNYRPLLRVTDRLAGGVVVNCRFVRDHLIRDEGVPEQRIHLCYNGLDTAEFHPRGRRKDGPELTVGVVCALRPEKGLPTLLEAFALASKTNPNLSLLIVGSGPMLPDLIARADSQGIAKRTQFRPTTSQVADLLRSIDIFVLPSLSEAFSNSLMEAMACECAAVASRTGGNPELIADGETGLLFEPGTAAELSAQIQRLAADVDLRRQLAARGAERVRRELNLQASAERMAEIYEDALSAREKTRLTNASSPA